MMKKLTFLIFALILAGFGTLTAVETPSPVPAQPSAEAAAPAPAEQPTAQFDALLSKLAPKATPTASCPGGLHGPCDTNGHCRGYACPLGEVRWCYYSSGQGLCDGSCYCW